MRAAGHDEGDCVCVYTPPLRLKAFLKFELFFFFVLKKLFYVPTNAFSSEKQYIL